ncbi:aminotransferase class IV family protein [Actibacterium sp. XHP0104]|uniref:aminotransferase class IV family protein n=1 Tax=Actibacterium sp. XHP0104 TaxID=2984335 RepID=UPI0021E8B025|nr:aminotransferase class IV family protein [Actibacterium sp. XHP0104]MCV2880457.1 aminotransferase class IV family protein [Actibacterium sp. XHP0104]
MESPLRATAPGGLILIETLRFEPRLGPLRGDLHLARMARGAAALGWGFDAARAAEMINVGGDEPLRLRLTLDAGGELSLTTGPYEMVQGAWRLGLAPERVQADDPWRGVKSSHRAIYDRARADLPEGLDELLFLNERGELAEGTITNVFIKRDRALLTPPLASGCLPGVLRETLLADGTAREAVLTPDDLHGAEAVFVGNSLRGLIPAVWAA